MKPEGFDEIYFKSKYIEEVLPFLEKHFDFKPSYIQEECDWGYNLDVLIKLTLYFSDKPHLEYLMHNPYVPLSKQTAEVREALKAMREIDKEARDNIQKNGGTACFYIPKSEKLKEIVKDMEISGGLYICLAILTHFYYKLTKAPKLETFSEEQQTEIESALHYDEISSKEYYYTHIRPDILELFLFVKDWKKQPLDETVTLSCKNKKIVLNNKQQWFFKALHDYFEKIELADYSVQDAKKELAEITQEYSKKAGRKPLNRFQILFIKGLDSLWQEVFETKVNTNEKCIFINNFLKYIGLPIADVDYQEDDIKNIRSRIESLRKSKSIPKWFETDTEGHYMNW